MKRIILIGLLAGITMLATGMVISNLFQAIAPVLKAEYNNVVLFREFSDPLMLLYFMHPFFLGIALAWLWSKIKTTIEGNSDFEKGLSFGLLIFVVATIPGMLVSYASFHVSLLMIASWTTSSFFELMIAGFIFTKTIN